MVSSRIGIVGLGKMGKNIALRLLEKGYGVVVYNRSSAPVEEIRSKGAEAAGSIRELASMLGEGRLIWLMLPWGEATDNAIAELLGVLSKGDIVVDGSNGKYTDDIAHAKLFAEKGIRLIDAGCSGGPSGALNGMSIMAGGDREAFESIEKVFKDLSVENGYKYIGSSGSGHYVKMVHNAIEYGMMQAIAEGMELLENGPYNNLDKAGICRLWNNGSVIRGYLMELAERALLKSPELEEIRPYVEDTGEGRWAAEAAIKLGVPLTSLTHALYERFSSRDEYGFGRRMLSALRHEFGGHEVTRVSERYSSPNMHDESKPQRKNPPGPV